MVVTGDHRVALDWFDRFAGQVLSWDAIQEFSHSNTRLVTQAKGIFKPAGLLYALSVRQTLSGQYPDKAVERGQGGTWSYQYHQEGTDPDDRDRLFTNRGLMMCHRDHVPIGVLIQTSAGKPAQYEVLGLASVLGWTGGFFTLTGPASIAGGA